MTEITHYFPFSDKITAPRESQIELFNKIIAAYKEGQSRFVLVMPTGAGKSPLVITLANYFKENEGYTSYYLPS